MTADAPAGEFWRFVKRHLLRGRGGGRIGLAGDQGAAGGEGPGIGRGLGMPALGRDPPDVDRDARESEQHDEEDGEDDEHLPARRGAAHQLTTIVVVACWTKRPFASCGRSALMNGTTMSDRYVRRTCTRHPAGSSVAQYVPVVGHGLVGVAIEEHRVTVRSPFTHRSW